MSIPWCDSVLQKITCAGWNARVKLGKRKKKSKRQKKQLKMRKNIKGKSKQKDKFALCMTLFAKTKTHRVREGEGSEMKPICVSLAANNMLVLNMVLSLCNSHCPHLLYSTQAHVLMHLQIFYTFCSISHSSTPTGPYAKTLLWTKVCMRRWAFTHVHRKTQIHIWYTGLKHDTVYLGSRIQYESPRNLSFLS